MQIILLSGGTGKRLWPLSNSARSKQFLQLLQTPDGKQKESMVQRVVRQIAESGLATSVTVVSGAIQRDSIEIQLGDRADMVLEPERRNTFPAIALAASHLAMRKGCSRDEIIVVVPSDAYADAEYFDTIARMVSLAERDVADLILMGIPPTGPSTDFGYVVPSSAIEEGYCMVQRFTEKPDAKSAEKLLELGAYWNAGVFAFRLGYLMDIVSRYVQAGSFEELHNRYDELPKISFDYEVAEVCESIAVVPYRGRWKDLGEWNALVEELPTTTMGNVALGDDTQDTAVINELSLPIVCDGVKNIVVAAGHDGILVCGRESSKYIKQYIDPTHMRPMFEQRRWGTYRVLDDTRYDDGSHSLTKSLTLHPGRAISYQKHFHRAEVWTFVEGDGLFVYDGEVRYVKAGDTVMIPIGHWHCLKAISKLTFIEVQMGNPLVEEDIARMDWDWSNTNLEQYK